MRNKQTLLGVLFALLTVFVLVIVASRASERSLELSGLRLDNDPSVLPGANVSPTPVPTPTPTINKPDIDISSWEYILANSENNIGSYTPPDTVAIPGFEAHFFDSRAVDALTTFLQAARDAGFSVHVMTAFRPYSTQAYIFNGKASQISWDGTHTYAEAVELAKKIVAEPGTSEHQTGLAVDITDKYYSSMDPSLMDQELFEWLSDNCAQYGFIYRYPPNKESVTGWNEPWHYRYVGVDAAEFMSKYNYCLEQFIALYK